MNKFATLALIAAIAAPAALANDLQNEHNTNREIVSNVDPRARELLLRPARIHQGRTYTLPVSLRAGKFYTFFGDCDNNCNNIDMNLIAANGARVAGDNLPDNAPLFTFHATRSGNYRVVLSMKNCDDRNGCKASIHAFEGTRRVYDTFIRAQ
ncbi:MULTISPECIES: hypothetical protein [Eikenella]|uniref:Uncharacterized protein n=1 Tax=Eikenella longinqua TaxID=1795827 RepID=A0A1A9RV38_9NEIS|nr:MULTISPECIES: hypothetical protein [Eikenella]OAM26058.1 hypothetical protein A7P95_10105 [Eikenella longinqua]